MALSLSANPNNRAVWHNHFADRPVKGNMLDGEKIVAAWCMKVGNQRNKSWRLKGKKVILTNLRLITKCDHQL